MKITEKNVGRGNYVSPVTDIVDVCPEGLLCGSAMTEDYVFNEIDW